MRHDSPKFVTGKGLQTCAIVLWLVFVALLIIGRVDIGGPLIAQIFLPLTGPGLATVAITTQFSCGTSSSSRTC